MPEILKLELGDTNITDLRNCDLATRFGVAFRVVT
jgi:hypothetical protein